MFHDNSMQVKTNAEVANPTSDNVEEAIQQLKIHDNQEEGTLARPTPYPNRPGEPNCDYYMRNGLCAYGSNCRYNHPPHAAQYYLKTGSCKYGSTCKYHHLKDRNGAGQLEFNVLGLPMRQDEKSCAYYMRYGSCKFGVECKFNHPQPASLGTRMPLNGAAAFGSTGSSVASSGMPYVGGVHTCSLSRETFVFDPRLQCSQAYMPVVLFPSQGFVPASDWNSYLGSLSSFSSFAQHNLLATASTSLPERPDQPECQYFMNNGTCKYGPDCKYHHPRERIVQSTASLLGPHGLPSRPGKVICSNYTTYGFCKFGPNCRYDHPLLGYLHGYPYPAFDASLFTYPKTAQTGWTQKPDGTISRYQNSGAKTKTSDLLPKPVGSPPPHSSNSFSESLHD